ncbi:MAG TPA: hypothetical protein VNW93_04055, partial [Mycobacterium sp.]|nr:hypothetical protein [Mycobacterium sp.]
MGSNAYKALTREHHQTDVAVVTLGVVPRHRAAEALPDTGVLGDDDDAVRLQLCPQGFGQPADDGKPREQRR